MQLKKGSFLHWLEQPSPFMEFISSHSSPLELKKKIARGVTERISRKCFVASRHASESHDGGGLCSPLYASVAAVGGPQLMHQRRRGLALAAAGDGLDLVGVRNVGQHIPAQRESTTTTTTTKKNKLSKAECALRQNCLFKHRKPRGTQTAVREKIYRRSHAPIRPRLPG